MDVRSQVPSEIAARVKQLMLFSRYRVDGRFMGENKSIKKGASTDFLQHRQYFSGDNIKYLDWRVYARTGKLVIREYEEQTNLDTWFVIDNSASMGFAGENESKYDYAMKIAAILTYILQVQKDSYGMALFSDDLKSFCDTGTSTRHTRRMFETALTLQPAQEANWEKALQQVQARIRRKGLILVISDFLNDPAVIGKSLSGFRSKGCDVIAFQVVDPFERTISQDNITQYIDIEDQSEIIADPLLIRDAYNKQFQLHCEAIGQECSNRGISYVTLTAEEGFEKAMGEFIMKRQALLL